MRIKVRGSDDKEYEVDAAPITGPVGMEDALLYVHQALDSEKRYTVTEVSTGHSVLPSHSQPDNQDDAIILAITLLERRGVPEFRAAIKRILDRRFIKRVSTPIMGEM